MTAVNKATGEVKYLVTNAGDRPLSLILRVAFRRASAEHAFRVGKQEAGLMHYEGRQYAGLVRHLVMALVVLGFVAEQTERLRGKNPDVTQEQVCRALNQGCGAMLSRCRRMPKPRHVGDVTRYHQCRNAQAANAHRKRQHRSRI